MLKHNEGYCLSADRLPNVYITNVPWFREDSFTTVRWVMSPFVSFFFFFFFPADLRIAFAVFCRVSTSVPSVTEISGMLHTSRPDNSSDVLLQLHTAPNCQYKVLLSTSPRLLGRVTTSDFLYMLMIIQDNCVLSVLISSGFNLRCQ